MNELTFQLDSKIETPLYEQIYIYIKNEIKEGRLCKNMKLPSARRLSTHLEVSRSTIDVAYGQLVSEGYVYAVPCKGYFVSDIELLVDMTTNTENISKIKRTALDTKINKQIDFNIGGIDLDSFPFSTWRKITKNVLSADNKELFKIGNSKGDSDFREVIRKYLYESRGVEANSSQIIVGAGNDYLIMVLSKFLGDVSIGMENPCYIQAYKMFNALEHKLCAIDMDEQGINVKKLAASNVDICYVTPSHQFPTGIVMPIKRRLELLKWAGQKDNRFIIEDDYDSEFRYVGKPIPSLISIDIDEKVIYMGTLSRSIAPAIRMSYMVLPKALVEKYNTNMNFFSSTVSRIDQTIVKEFMEDGYFERHLNKMRSIYKTKHDLLISEIKKMKTPVYISGQNAGVHITLQVDNQMEEEKLISSAKENGIIVYGLSNFTIGDYDNYSNNGLKSNILLGFAGLTADEIVQGILKLDKAWEGK